MADGPTLWPFSLRGCLRRHSGRGRRYSRPALLVAGVLGALAFPVTGVSQAQEIAGTRQTTFDPSVDPSVVVPDFVPIATVDDVPIGAAELEDRIARWTVAQSKDGHPPTLDEIRRRRSVLARQLVDEALIFKAAAERGLALDNPSDAQILEKLAKRLKIRQPLESYFAARGGTSSELVRERRAEILLHRLTVTSKNRPDPTKAEIAAHYDLNRNVYQQPAMVRLLRLRWPAGPWLTARQREHVAALAAEAAAAADLEDWLTRRASPFAGNLKTVGWFDRDSLPEEVARWAFAAPVGKRSSVIKTEPGFEVVLLQARRKVRTVTLKGATQEIRSTLYQGALQARRARLLARLRDQWRVEEPYLRELLAAARRARKRQSELGVLVFSTADSSSRGTAR